MTSQKITRRRLMAGAAGSGSCTALGAVPLTGAAEAGVAPYPTLPGGRLMPREPQVYGDSMMSGGPPKDGIPAIDTASTNAQVGASWAT